jgi:hypothetical protein
MVRVILSIYEYVYPLLLDFCLDFCSLDCCAGRGLGGAAFPLASSTGFLTLLLSAPSRVLLPTVVINSHTNKHNTIANRILIIRGDGFNERIVYILCLEK